MRKSILSLLFLAFLYTQPIAAQCGDLYIGGVIDGPLSGGVPKGVQICASANIPDLSIFGMGSANNAGGTDGEEFSFPPASLDAGQCFWVASESTGFNSFFGFTPCFTNSAANINGDDSIELFCNGTVVDVFGVVGQDGSGQCWDHLDGWAVTNLGSSAGAFDCADWTFSGINALDGEATNAGAATPYPSPAQTCPVPLPITLSSFHAKGINDNAVQLSWTTASEQDNEYFSIEYSTDGRVFSEIAIVDGAGNSFVAIDYQYTHQAAVRGNNYYRLHQVDFSGESSYSDVLVVELGTTQIMSIRPTFAKDDIYVITEKELTSQAVLEVFNLSGQRVMSSTFPAYSGQIELKVDALEHGHYFIRLTTDQSSESARFIKL